jgi:hypothetical protein
MHLRGAPGQQLLPSASLASELAAGGAAIFLGLKIYISGMKYTRRIRAKCLATYRRNAAYASNGFFTTYRKIPTKRIQ